jgi:large subunit ribosomal protein L15
MSGGARIGSLKPAAGATRTRKRRGKGTATGIGGTAGKGHKGHKARAGGKIPVWFEGGQMPIQRRLPKRGFHNPTRVEYQVVNLGRLAAVPAGTTVDRSWLRSQGIVRRPGPIKLLAGGTLQGALTVQVDAASEKARQMVEAAGGTLVLAARKREAAVAPRAAMAPAAAAAPAAGPAAPAAAPETPRAPKRPPAKA